MKRVLLGVLAVILVLPGLELKAQDSESDAPYLYYYDETVRAFVVERADGTDRHLLGEGLLQLPEPDPDAEYVPEYLGFLVHGPGWSPSGEWFAWIATPRVQVFSGPNINTPHIVNTNGTRMVTGLNTANVVTMEWAPDQDILFAVETFFEEVPEDEREVPEVRGRYHKRFLLIDPVSDSVKMLYETSFALNYFPRLSSRINWLDDDRILVEDDVYKYFGDEWSVPVIRLFDLEHQISEATYPSLIRQVPEITSRITYAVEDGIQVEHILTQESWLIPHNWNTVPDSHSHYITWNGDYGLIIHPSIGLISLEESSLKPLGDLTYLEYSQWWSPNGNYALITDRDALYFIDIVEGTFQALLQSTSPPSWKWLDNETAFIHVSDSLYEFNTVSQKLTDLHVDGYIRYPDFDVSPDRQQVAYIRDGVVIRNLESGDEIGVRPDARSSMSAPGGQVYWHEDGEWLIVLEDALIAGGANIRYMGVVRRDGTMRRDLGDIVTPTNITIDWLPDRVDPSRMPETSISLNQSALQTILKGNTWSYQISWGPDNLLASSWETLTMWDLNTETVISQVELNKMEQTILWEGDKATVEETVFHCTEIPRYQTVGCTRDGEYIVVRNQDTDEEGFVYHIASEQRLCNVYLTPDWMTSISVSPDGKYLAIGWRFYNTPIWNLETCELALTMPDPAPGVAFSPDGKYLALGVSWDIQIWDVEELLSD